MKIIMAICKNIIFQKKRGIKESYAEGFTIKLNERFAEQREINKDEWALVVQNDNERINCFVASKYNVVQNRSKDKVHVFNQAHKAGYNDCEKKFGETGQKQVY